jgi:amino acid adenylation domain-containing protein
MSDRDSSKKPASELTKSQTLIWMSQQLSPDAPLFNMAHRFDLLAEIDAAQFKRALQAVVDGSDALRTVFRETESGVRQEVLDTLAVDVPVLDFTGDAAPEESASDWMRGRASEILDLSKCSHESALLKIASAHWVWFMNIHHLVADAWSMSLICAAVGRNYASERNQEAGSPRVLPAFLDYRRHESEWQSSKGYQDAASYWRDCLERPAGLVALYGRKGTRGLTDAERYALSLGPDRSAQLRELEVRPEYRSLSIHLTRFNLLATVAFAYLHRVGQASQITIGTPSHNRTSLAFRETIGLFIETLPFTVQVAEGETFHSLFDKVSTESKYFLRYAQPGCSSPSLSRQFNVVFNYINVSFGDFEGIPMKSSLVHSGRVDSGHDLRIQVHDLESSGNLVVYFDIKTGTLDRVISERVGDHFLRVLDAFLADPSRLISSVDLTSEPEKVELLEDFNQANTTHRPWHLLEVFRDRVSETPERAAVVLGDAELSYAELERRSEHLAAELLARGVGNSAPVGICATRSTELIIALLGVIKSGVPFVPLEAHLPDERLRHIIEDSKLSHVLCSTSSAYRGSDSEVDWLCVEELLVGDEGVGKGALPDARPDSAAYILYTSGSTGLPKGVVVSHAALEAYVSWALRSFGRNAPCDMPLYSAIGFDLTITSMFVPLASGGTVVVYPEAGQGTDLSVLQVFEDDCVDVVKLTPSHLSLVLEQPRRLNRIRSLMLGGENLETDLANRALAALGEIEIFNEYGPTEAVVGCMEHRYEPLRDVGHSVPIGIPATHHRVYLLDQARNPVPLGVTGEIYVAGEFLSDGYLNRPEETSDKFLADPFQPSGRMYRTGDLARFSEKGMLEYLGRADLQLKFGGVRLEPAEVRHAVTTFPGIVDCVVDVIEPEGKTAGDEVYFCARCGLSSEYPDVSFDAQGVCNLCTEFDTYRDKAQVYFSDMGRLQELLDDARERRTGKYDCIALLSGGKDSTYALYRVAELGPKILALTLDNGFISEDSKSNIGSVVESLGIDHRFISDPAMNEIFSDSLKRHSNVCQGCFKTIYTLAVNIALEEGVPYIVTGLSRGQFFETRLTSELFRGEDVDLIEVEDTILQARKAYHGIDDAVSRCLDVSALREDDVFHKVGFIDFYRYCDVSLDEVYRFLADKAPWIRPRDTGRSTNCLINDAGIYVHKRKEGYHNYALPYSWDVRMGHKTRDASIDELNDQIDVIRVHQMLDEIGYEEDAFKSGSDRRRLVVYYTAEGVIDEQSLRGHVARYLPTAVVPSFFVEIDEIPLTRNGKLDRAALPAPKVGRPPVRTVYLAPRDELETAISQVWREVLDIRRVGIADNFYALGGDSITAIQIAARASERGLAMAAIDIFEHQTVESLAEHMKVRGHQDSGSVTADQGDGADPERFSLANLDDELMSKVEKMLSERPE